MVQQGLRDYLALSPEYSVEETEEVSLAFGPRGSSFVAQQGLKSDLQFPILSSLGLLKFFAAQR